MRGFIAWTLTLCHAVYFDLGKDAKLAFLAITVRD
jgi:hypothetical protein